ncbi:uncharacterized protein (DUF1800 family) [Caulobacter ginsengisoli]|uniref:Uncharacterized protein (DUF1800 family) n=2 Tax=Caulobacter ginsengisoli TaxID=400775 RepID=A0ABU0IL89_9CAUL|nr:uncharacterized protein (DUF1800 family) [Caulobacter ginsengisoli]
MMAAIAVTRFGLGARPGELETLQGDPQGWLKAQIRKEGADPIPNDGASSVKRLTEFAAYRRERRAAKADGEAALGAARLLRDDVGEDFVARARLGATTPAGFRERWALFWANHFTASATKLITAVVVGPYENEAIRPHVFGRFGDLLIASASHPAMLTYLDQFQSVGPDSPGAQFAARRQNRTAGLNENLAREILELHTVGVDGGYSQADVTEFARAMTGWSIGGPREPQRQGQFVFRAATHEPGSRTIMGRRYDQDGVDQAAAVMADLAAHPATARHVCGKIARHFVADDPPAALTDRLVAAWTASRGDLAVVANTLITANEAWDPTPAKFKTPYEFLISGWRAIGGQPTSAQYLAPLLTGMGQRPFAAPSPKGWADDAVTWCAPDAVIKRMSWAEGFAAVVAQDRDPNRIAAEALGARLSPQTAKAVARAESRPEALALLLMSPEFQRR